MNTIKPIILLASERSGTNLLRAMVSSHSAVASPPPCSVVGLLANGAYKYVGPLHAQSHEDELIADVILTTEMHLNPWDVRLTHDQIRERMGGETSFWKLFKAMNDLYAEAKHCTYWFSKEPDMFNHIYEIALHMPEARFIYMVRDGRDVAASMLKGGLHESHIYIAALRWAGNQKRCLAALSDSLLSKRIFLLKYEELISQPEQTGAELMKFLGLEFESGQVEFYKNKEVREHAQKSEFWKNLSRPIDASNKGNYKKSLTKRQIQIFESVAWDEMHALGYQPESLVRKPVSMLEKGLFRLSAALRRKAQQFSSKEEMKKQNARRAAARKIAERNFWK